LYAPIPLTEDQKEGLTGSVHDCLIRYSLLAPPEIKIELAIAEVAVPHLIAAADSGPPFQHRLHRPPQAVF
jgi:hypothetical protein